MKATRAATSAIGLMAAMVFTTSAMAGPILYIDDSAGNLGKVDVATGAVTLIGNTGQILTDIAFDPSGNLFGITFGSLYRINKTTGTTTFIGNTGQSLNSLVFSASGTLYAAGTSLFTLNTSTGAASLVGSGGGYTSSGDLAFVGGNLYLSSSSTSPDSLFRLSTTTGVGTFVGNIGFSSIFGLATSDNVNLFGVGGTSIYAVSPTSGAGTLLVGYGGQGLGAANGTAFLSEAGAAVPEPQSLGLLGLGLVALVAARRRRRR